MSSSEDESTSDKGGSPNTQPEKSKKGSTSAKVNSGMKLFGQRKFSNSAINRFANGGPPPGVGAAKRHLDKDLTDEEDGNGSQGGGQPRSKKKKNQNDDLDDLSSQGAGTPPLTFSNNSCMLFIVLGGGVSHLTRCLHGLSTDDSHLGPDSSPGRRLSSSSTSERSSSSVKSRKTDDARSDSLRNSNGLAPSMEWSPEGT